MVPDVIMLNFLIQLCIKRPSHEETYQLSKISLTELTFYRKTEV